MCGRYAFAQDPLSVGAEFDAHVSREQLLHPTGEIFPTNRAYFLQADPDGGRQLSVGSWGVVPPWAAEFKMKGATFNAKSETAAGLATWRTPLKKWRAAVPMTAYYEWRSSDPSKKTAKKQRYEIHDENAEVFLLAGLFSPWRDKSLPEDHPDAWRLSFTVLTQAAPSPEDPDPALAALGALHNRLPVPLAPQMLDEWLDRAQEDGAGLLEKVNAAAFDLASSWRLRPVRMIERDGWPAAELEESPIA